MAMVKNLKGEVAWAKGCRADLVDKQQPAAELNLLPKQEAFHESAHGHTWGPVEKFITHMGHFNRIKTTLTKWNQMGARGRGVGMAWEL